MANQGRPLEGLRVVSLAKEDGLPDFDIFIPKERYPKIDSSIAWSSCAKFINKNK